MEGRPSTPKGAKRKNGDIFQGSQRYPAGYAEKYNPGHVKDSVSEATEVLSGMLNTHKFTEDRISKKGKGSTSPTYAAATRGQIPQKDWNGSWWEGRNRKKISSCALCAET